MLACALACAATSAQGGDLALDVQGCAEPDSPARALPDALRLELSPEWRVATTDDAPVRVRVSLEGCAADAWTIALLDAEGAVRRGPVALDVRGFPASARTRIAALWIAEWLATLAPAESPPAVARSSAPAPLETPPAPAPRPPSPPRPRVFRARIGVMGAFRQVPETPASLAGAEVALHLVWGRWGAELAGGVEAGVRWSNPMAVVRGSLGLFYAAPITERFSVDVGLRLTLADLVYYELRFAARDQTLRTAHGGGGVFGRALLRMSARASLAVDLEGGYNPWYAENSVASGQLSPPEESDRILGGFTFAARVGVVFD